MRPESRLSHALAVCPGVTWARDIGPSRKNPSRQPSEPRAQGSQMGEDLTQTPEGPRVPPHCVARAVQGGWEAALTCAPGSCPAERGCTGAAWTSWTGA